MGPGESERDSQDRNRTGAGVGAGIRQDTMDILLYQPVEQLVIDALTQHDGQNCLTERSSASD